MTTPSNADSDANAAARPRRALIIAETAATLPAQLAASGYETYTATMANAARAISDFAPDVLIIELPPKHVEDADDIKNAGVEGTELGLARRLRAEASTYALPLVFAWSTDQRSVRNAALSIGVDDYFALATPLTQTLARLDALFWRIEAGRRAAPVIGDQRGEIDNFMLMLDSVREEIAGGANGTLALVYAISHDAKQPVNKAMRDRTLAKAHGFLKLNLRRIDAIAFYGPTTLLVYLPRMASSAAIATLARLRGEFLNERLGNDLAIGIASFPDDGKDIETLIGKAETAVEATRSQAAHARVVASSAAHAKASSPAATQSAPPQASPILEPPAQASTTSSTPDSATTTAEQEPSVAPLSTRLVSSGVTRETKTEDEVRPPDREMPVHDRQPFQTSGTDFAQAALEAAARERERRSGGATMPRRLLLAISDAARMAQLNSLIRSAGYEARAAFDGQQALDLLRIERPDLLVLDYELHGINGVETLRRMQQQGGGRLTLPVLLLIPAQYESARSEALTLGARGVVAMPCDPADFLDNVRVAGSVE
ncbi:MAG: response regulator [Pyrinomonadaceae bacterium]